MHRIGRTRSTGRAVACSARIERSQCPKKYEVCFARSARGLVSRLERYGATVMGAHSQMGFSCSDMVPYAWKDVRCFFT
jgi:hypothetical protein